MDWVEVRAKTVDSAVEAALADLGIESIDHAQIEVLQEPERGFLGLGGKDAVVRVKAKPKPKRRRSRKRSRSSSSSERRDQGGGSRQGGRGQRSSNDQRSRTKEERPRSKGDDRRKKSGTASKDQKRSARQRPEETMDEKTGRGSENSAGESKESNAAAPSPEEQAQVVEEFLSGLLQAFGLEGEVDTRSDGGVIYADITGEQTEALVGAKGSILQAILELCRTVVQRKTRSGARIRLDIAGYTARRREALKIYAQRLANQVLDDGQEVMLEPMNPADRKVVHDAVAEMDGVRSYSEGEEPHRSVVVGLAPGIEPRAAAEEGSGEDDDRQEATADSMEDDDGDSGDEAQSSAEEDEDDEDGEDDGEPGDDEN